MPASRAPRSVASRFLAVIGARVIHELGNDGFHLLDVGDDGLPGRVVGDAHFGFETQAGERGAQVVRDAGEDFRAILLVSFEVAGHGIEGAGQQAHFLGAGFRQRRRAQAASDGLGGFGHGLERAADARGDQPGDGERQRQRQQAPEQPVTGDAAHGAFARQDQPVFFFVMVVEAKADPEAGDAIDFGGDPRVRPEAGGQFALDQVVEARIRHRFDTVVGFRRQQPDALAGR